MRSPYELKHSDFTDEIAIVCPRCAAKATVKGPGLYKEGTDNLTYCVCIHCGYNQKYRDKKADIIYTSSNNNVSGYKFKLLGGEVDPFFHHPLWYSASYSAGTIWAYNLAHLEVIETFIASKNRSRNGLPYQNSSIASRLPKWMSAAKHRDAVLKVIKELKAKDP